MDSEIKLQIFNLDGELIKTLVNAYNYAGVHKRVWDGIDNNGDKVSEGIFLIVMETENRLVYKKMILIKW